MAVEGTRTDRGYVVVTQMSGALFRVQICQSLSQDGQPVNIYADHVGYRRLKQLFEMGLGAAEQRSCRGAQLRFSLMPTQACSASWMSRRPRYEQALMTTAAASLATVLLVVLSGCTASNDAPTPPPSSARSPLVTGSTADARCSPSPRASGDGVLRGESKEGQLWALGGSANTGEQFKIVVKMTGTGEMSSTAIGPDGSRLPPDEIVMHPSSNFNRPGDEWGVFYSFDRPGCWRLTFMRSDVRGVISLAVRRG